MISSMTAFAQVSADTDQGTLIWTLRSVNHRYLEIQPRLPDELRGLEPEVRERIKAALQRGKVEAQLQHRFDEVRSTARLNLNPQLADNLIELLEAFDARLKPNHQVDLVRLLQWPGLIEPTRPDESQLLSAALVLLDEALLALSAARRQEGTDLAAVITTRLDGMTQQLAIMDQHRRDIRGILEARFKDRLAGLDLSFEPSRLEQEIALQLQKLDIDEELDRLRVHGEEVRRVLQRSEPCGRRLDFLMQELNREANTLGSKASTLEVSQVAVELKVLIEQMREQVQNIE
jgi:uncharacterized protein (TIGR00255 family)